MKTFDESMNEMKQQLDQENQMTDQVYSAIANAVNEGEFAPFGVDNGYSTAMIEHPNSKKLTIVIGTNDCEYEICVRKKVSHDKFSEFGL